MNSMKLLSSGLALLVSGGAAFVVAAQPGEQPPRKGPYKVVISKPIDGPGHTLGTLYGEHEYLTAMLNQLDKDGLRPVISELLTQGTGGGREEIRMLMVCVDK